MPSTTPERAARWYDDDTAISYLVNRDFKLSREWEWTHPSKKLADLTFDEEDAIIYLIEEWDFGGLVDY